MTILRGNSLRAQVSRTLVGLGLLSVVLLASVNFFVIRKLLNERVDEQLISVRSMRQESVEFGFERFLNTVSSVAADPGVADALVDLASSYKSIDVELTSAQLDELEGSYAEVVAPYDEVDAMRLPTSELMPSSLAGQYVQYNYITQNPNPRDERLAVDDAGDGSTYSAAHAEHHDFLKSLAASLGVSDLMLVDAETGEVIYSVNKYVDIGTNTKTGPYSDGGLGASLDRVSLVAAGEAALADSAFHIPSGTTPTIHVSASVRAQTEVLGAIVVGMPIDIVTDVVTAAQRWDLLGLGDTGDVYIVGPDLALRTIPRSWSEDPAKYLERFDRTGGDERTSELMEFTGSPVLLQPVDNDAIESALDGEDYIGKVSNYLDRKTITAAAPLDLPGVDWVVVTEQQVSEARDQLERFILAIAVLLLVLLPLLALIGVALARALARPVGPLVDAAGRIAQGDFESEVPDLGRNELGDLADQLRVGADQLREQEEAIEAEELRISDMLGSVLPHELVERVRSGERDIANVLDIGTVIALSIRGLPEPSGAEQDAVLELVTELSGALRDLAGEHGIERIRIASDQQLFVAGRTTPGPATQSAIEFASAALELVTEIASDYGVGITGHAALATGEIASGILGSTQLSFGIWGEPTAIAIALSAEGGPGEILADGAAALELGESWSTSPIELAGSSAGPVRDVFRVFQNTADAEH